jgi:hypothetical protein
MKIKDIVILLISGILFIVNCEEESSSHSSTEEKQVDIFENLKAYRIRSETELRFLTEISDMTFLLFYYKPGSESSKKVAHHLKSVLDKIDNIASVILINCETFLPKEAYMCKELDYSRDSFPRLKLLIPPEKRWDPILQQLEVHYEYPWTESEMTEKTIYNFITTNIPDKSIKLTNENLHSFLNSDLFNKVLLFTNKAQPSLNWKALTGNYHEQILFGQVFHNKDEIIKKFNVTKFPTLILYQVNDKVHLLDEPQIKIYEGPLSIDKILEWLKPYVLNQKKYISQKRNIPDSSAKELANSITLDTVDHTNYQDHLIKFQDRDVLYYFNTKNNPKLSIKEQMTHNNLFFSSKFFDCEKDRKFCLDKFNVTKFPMLKLIPRQDENLTSLEQRIANTFTFDISKSATETFEDQLKQFYSSNIRNITNIEASYAISEIKFEDKNIIIDLHDDEEEFMPIALQLLSNDKFIQKYFKILRVKNPSPELLKLNRIPDKSGLFFLYKLKGIDEYRVIPVSRNSFYSSLMSIAQNLVYIQQNYRGRPNFHSEIIKQVTTKAQLRKDCLDLEYCVLAFFDARPTEENIEKFNQEIEKIERIKMSSKRYEFFQFNWVNATCHSYLAEKFDIDMKKLPGVTYYYRYRNTYSTFIGMWEIITLAEYFERCVNDRCPTKDIENSDVTFRNVICEQLHGENSENMEDHQLIRDNIEHTKDSVKEKENSTDKIKENTTKENSELKVDL